MQEIPIKSFSVSVVILRETPDRCEILLLQRADTLAGHWCQVAGSLEPRETGWQAALREVTEETGLTAAKLYSADMCEQYYDVKRDIISVVPVFAAYVHAHCDVVLNDEHRDFRWTTPEEAMTLVPFSGQRRILEHVKREFIDRTANPLLLIVESDQY